MRGLVFSVIRSSRAVLMAVCWAALSMPGQAQTASQTYDSRAACEQSDRLTSAQCGFAFQNARAEFEEKAPRYRARQDCQRLHKVCAAQLVGASGFGDLSRSGAIYVPRFQGVTVQPAKQDAMEVVPRIAAGSARFKPRRIDAADDRIDGRVAVVPDSRGQRGGSRVGNDPQSSGPYIRRGDRDDTIRMKLEVRDPNDPNATGLFVDKNGVEWYRPSRRR